MVGPMVDTKSIRTLNELIALRARDVGDAEFLISVQTGRVVTYEELATEIQRWRSILDSNAIVGGNRVGLTFTDPLEFALVFVSLLANGLWVAPLDPGVVRLPRDAFDERLRPLALDVVVSDQSGPVGSKIPWLVAAGNGRRYESQSGLPETSFSGGVILASSGTTGTPKVIALPESQLMHAAHLIASHNGLEAGSRGFNPLPLWHINAEVVAVLATLVAGSSVVLADRFHRTDFWRTIDRLEVTWINAVPAIVARLTSLRDGEVIAPRIRFIRSASAPLSPLLLSAFEELTKIRVVETYGMTEAASQICANPLEGIRKPGSVGPPVGVEVRVINTEPSQAHSGALVGHVEIRGPSVVDHYESIELADRFAEGGWLRTGDLGYFDDDGYLFLVGRSDDVINRSGEKIFPREIEEVVVAVDGVAHAAVIGRAHDVFGEVPVLYLEMHNGDPVSIEAAVELVRRKVDESFARDRRPAEIIIVEAMPTHATGKIQKKALESPGVKVLKRWNWS